MMPDCLCASLMEQHIGYLLSKMEGSNTENILMVSGLGSVIFLQMLICVTIFVRRLQGKQITHLAYYLLFLGV